MPCPICGNDGPNCDCTSEERRMHEKAEELLDRVAALEAAVPRWISVSERLPEKNANVLVWIPTAAEKTFIASLDEGGMWFSSDPAADGYSLGEHGAPTHWMPLPPPPGATP